MTGRYPRRFGKYVLLKPLAKGGMGEIYLAAGGEVGGFEKLCVIKKVITEKADRAKANRFLDEAKVVLRLSHSALVTTFDAGDVAGEFYIAMELVEGKDLREVWNRCVRTRQRIPLDVALHVVREVARSLAYVHGYGDLKLVHRDVAPPNILLAYVGDVKLTDFGLARSILKQEHTAPGVVFGRAAYLAPEQARGEVADARTDVYTLGIVLWELLTGQQFLQLSGLDPAAALAIVRHPKLVAPSTRAPWISPALDKVVTKALAADRDQRFQTADELRQSLSDVIGEIAPRADAARVAEFLRGIYAETIDEERTERDAFLKEVIPQFRATLSDEPAAEPPADPSPSPPTPLRTVKAPVAATGSERVALRLPGLPPTVVPPRNGSAERRPTPALGEAAVSPATKPPPPPIPLRALAAASAEPVAARPSAPPVPVMARPVPKAEERPPEAKPTAGRVVAGHRLVRPVMEGRLGSVHTAEKPGGGETAVRILEPARTVDSAVLERMRADAGRVARLGNPHVAGALEVGVADDGRVYSILEPCAGTDLASLLRAERRFEGARAVDIATQLGRALGAAHGVGVRHGQLEPERVLVTASATGDLVRVLDLGLGEGAGAADIISAHYRAPEQHLGQPTDERADIYALGAILYEMVTGAPPSTSRKLNEPVQSPRMFRPEIPMELERLILASLERDPARRPPNLAAFEEALGSVSRTRSESGLGGARAAHAPSAGQERRRARREAAFQSIGELVSMANVATPLPGPVTPPPARSPSSRPSLRPPESYTNGHVEGPRERSTTSSSGVKPDWTPSPSFGGAVLERYGATPGKTRWRLVRQLLLVAGAIGVAAALVSRFLR